jgi:hypothetical protein
VTGTATGVPGQGWSPGIGSYSGGAISSTIKADGGGDLVVSGTSTTGNLSVTGISTLTGNVTTQNVEVQQTLTANILVGNANNAIFAAIAAAANSAADGSVALAIALG